MIGLDHEIIQILLIYDKMLIYVIFNDVVEGTRTQKRLIRFMWVAFLR